jgi:predicted MFS family arabinose efflux permease
MTLRRLSRSQIFSPATIALAGLISLAVAMGIGRFAFTPLMPMMLRDGVVDLDLGGSLASANYLGYLAGAMVCMGLPRIWSHASLVRGGLVATVLLTAGMALPLAEGWLVLRFLAGVASAVVFVYTAGWSLSELAKRDAEHLSGFVFSGPGLGIALSGLLATGMIWSGASSAVGWVGFGVLALLMSAAVWPVLGGRTPLHAVEGPGQPGSGFSVQRSSVEMAVFAIAYGLAGFGYIVTATYLPVIARQALHESIWLDLFWPVFGIASVVGCYAATRVTGRVDPRALLAFAYIVQAIGVILVIPFPSVSGFTISSVLAGLPFLAINFFAMKEVRRLRPHHVARFMGMLTALFGIGQIAGPSIVSVLLRHAVTPAAGFASALEIASITLTVGAIIYLAMIRLWPMNGTIPAEDADEPLT